MGKLTPAKVVQAAANILNHLPTTTVDKIAHGIPYKIESHLPQSIQDALHQNKAPVLTGKTPTVQEDSPMGTIKIDLTQFYTDRDHDTLSFGASTKLPAGFTLSKNILSVDTTDTAFDHLHKGDLGVYKLPLTVDDGHGHILNSTFKVNAAGHTDSSSVNRVNVTDGGIYTATAGVDYFVFKESKMSQSNTSQTATIQVQGFDPTKDYIVFSHADITAFTFSKADAFTGSGGYHEESRTYAGPNGEVLTFAVGTMAGVSTGHVLESSSTSHSVYFVLDGIAPTTTSLDLEHHTKLSMADFHV
jgi:hypothetical protein